MNIKIIILILFVNVFNYLYSQKVNDNIGVKETLEYIQSKLGKDIKIDLKEDLNIKFYKNGELFREDWVNPTFLDHWLVEYLPEEKVLCLRCRADNKDCVARKLILIKKKDMYPRLTIPINTDDPKTIEGLKKAFIHLLKLLNYPNYKSIEPFE